MNNLMGKRIKFAVAFSILLLLNSHCVQKVSDNNPPNETIKKYVLKMMEDMHRIGSE